MDRLKLLIVDDKPENLLVLERVLEDIDVDIITASSGNEAVSEVCKHNFALILMDVQMPQMDGFETAEHIRRDEKNKVIPIIFISAIYRNEYCKIKGVASGGIDFISKPIIEEVLIGKVRLFLQLYKYQEDLKEYAKKAEKASEAKSRFLSHMSHEIRTPMNAILGFAEILKDKVSDPEVLHDLTMIQSSGESLLCLINDALDLSKVEAGKMTLVYGAVSMDKIVAYMEEIFSYKIKEKGLRFISQISSNFPEALLLDEVRLRQILINLIGNALKFTEKGHIKVSAQFSCPDEQYKDIVDINICVEDTGIGIVDAQKQRIFEPFEQSYEVVEKYGGTGLGLSISRKLLDVMGGRISVESNLGRGSSFTVSLSGVEIVQQGVLETDYRPEDDLTAIKFEDKTILMVDDIAYNRGVLKGFLREYDFVLLEADGGKEAIEKARAHHPDLILLDIKMPEMNGCEVVEFLNKDDQLKSIPVIAVTASTMGGEREKALNSFHSYLRKPFSKKELILQIMKFLPYIIKKQESVCMLQQQEEKVLFSQSLRVLPFPLIEKLHSSAVKGDIDELMKFIKDLGPEHMQISQRLERMVNDFRLEEIIQMTKDL